MEKVNFQNSELLEQEVQKKFRELLYQAEVNGEKVVNKVCLFTFVFGSLSFAILYYLTGFDIKQPSHLTTVLGMGYFFLYHGTIHLLLRKGLYHPSFKYLTVISNSITTLVIIYGFTFEISIMHTLRTSTIMIYFVIMALSVFYRKAFIPIFSAIITTAQYTVLVLIGKYYFSMPIIMAESFTDNAFSVELYFSFIPIIILVGILLTIFCVRFNNLFLRSLRSEIETHKLEKEKIVIKESARLKNNFFINLAHETKTPLTLISNYFNQLIQKVGVSDESEIIRSNIEKLMRDMVNFLDAEKLARGKHLNLHKEIIDFSSILNEKVRMFRSIAVKKSIELVAHIQEPIIIKSELLLLDKIINNIIDNAIKYSDYGSDIKIILTADSDKIFFKVADNGIGIPTEKLKTIFLPYHQAGSEKLNIQGMGMGLHIVKTIVDSMNGTIDVESTINEGTTFTITFDRYFLKENERISITPDIIQPFDYAPKKKTLVDKEASSYKKTILLVEDNESMLAYLQSNMEDEYNIYLAYNGLEALEKLKKIGPPDLIISDIMMDKMDGNTFYNTLQENEKYQNVPFIFLTAYADIHEQIKGLKQGAIDYIPKPFSMDALLAKVKSIIQNQAFHDELHEKEKFAALGILTSGMCHEILDPLNLIYPAIEFIQDELHNVNNASNSKITNDLDKIIKHTGKIEKIVKSIKMITFINDLEKEPVDTEKLLNKVLDHFVHKVRDRIQFEVNIDPKAFINGDKEALFHILYNLISNSIEAIEKEGTISVSILTESNLTIIKVEDTGQGMTKEIKESMYNAFYSGNTTGKRIGLGLYIVKQLILKSGWSITCNTQPGTGTEFIIKTS